MKFINISLALSFSCLFIGCGGNLGIKEQANPKKTPFKNPFQSFNLQTETDSEEFEGSFLIWANDPKKEDLDPNLNPAEMSKELDLLEDMKIKHIASVLRDSVAVKFLKAKAERFYYGNLPNAKDAQAKLKEEIPRKIEKFFFDNYSLIDDFYSHNSAKALGTTSTWLEDKLKKDKKFKDSLGGICEALVWDFALRPFLRENNFTSRPIPLSICENYYKTHDFFQGESCEKADRSSDYLACFWKEGVLKTSFLSVSEKKFIDELVSHEDFEAVLAHSQKDEIMKGNFQSLGLPASFANSLKPNDYISKFPSQIKDLLKVRLPMGVSGEGLSYHDRLFNLHRVKGDRVFFVMTGEYITGLNNEAMKNPNLYGEPLSDDLNAPEERKMEISLKESIDTLNKQYDTLEDDLLSKRKSSGESIIQNNLAFKSHPAVKSDLKSVEVVQSDMKVTFKIKDALLVAAFSLNKHAKNMGRCFDLKENKAVDCSQKIIDAEGFDTDSDNKLTFNYDPATSQFQFVFEMVKLESLGLSYRDSDEDEPTFQLIKEDVLQGKNIVCSFYFGDLTEGKYSGLQILSGDVFIQDPHDGFKNVYRGSSTLLRARRGSTPFNQK